MRILVITNTPPVPFHLGGGPQRTDLLLRALESCGEVSLLFVRQPGICTREALERARARYHVLDDLTWDVSYWDKRWGWAKRLPGALSQAAQELAIQSGRYLPDPAVAHRAARHLKSNRYDVVVCRYLQPMLRSGVFAAAKVPLLLDLDDLESEKLRLQLASSRDALKRPSWQDRLRIVHLKRLVMGALRRCNHVWFTNEEDRRLAYVPRSSVLPNIPWTPNAAPICPCPPCATSQEIVFVGNLSYEPNCEGLDYFVRRVWPQVRQAVAGARLRIAGVYLQSDMHRRYEGIPGVEVAGYVEDLAPLYERAAFSIAPIYWGGGTKIKVIESLAYGRTCVATPQALCGFRDVLRHEESVWCGDDDAGFAGGCIRLLVDPAGRESMAEHGRRVVSERFHFGRFQQAVQAAIETVIRPGDENYRRKRYRSLFRALPRDSDGLPGLLDAALR